MGSPIRSPGCSQSGAKMATAASSGAREAPCSKETFVLLSGVKPKRPQWISLDLHPILSGRRAKEACVGLCSSGGFGFTASLLPSMSLSGPGPPSGPPSLTQFHPPPPQEASLPSDTHTTSCSTVLSSLCWCPVVQTGADLNASCLLVLPE